MRCSVNLRLLLVVAGAMLTEVLGGIWSTKNVVLLSNVTSSSMNSRAVSGTFVFFPVNYGLLELQFLCRVL